MALDFYFYLQIYKYSRVGRFQPNFAYPNQQNGVVSILLAWGGYQTYHNNTGEIYVLLFL